MTSSNHFLKIPASSSVCLVGMYVPSTLTFWGHIHTSHVSSHVPWALPSFDCRYYNSNPLSCHGSPLPTLQPCH